MFHCVILSIKIEIFPGSVHFKLWKIKIFSLKTFQIMSYDPLLCKYITSPHILDMYGPGTSYLDYGSDEDDGPVPAHYLMEDAVPDYRLTRSEQDLNNLMFSQSEGDAAMER